jgi:hypothetical protein
MSLPSERIDPAQDIIYLAKHPSYEFALTRSMPSYPDPNPEAPLVRLRFMSQPSRQDLELTVTALEQFYDALGRLLDYVAQERAHWTARRSLSAPMADPIGLASEQLGDETAGDGIEAAPAAIRLIRPVSARRLCRMNGAVLAGLIALVSWALYSLSAGNGEVRRPQSTLVHETLQRPHAASISYVMPPSADTGAAQLAPDEDGGTLHGRTDADQPPSQADGPRPQPPMPLSQAAAHTGPTPHVYLHIQSPAQHAAAERLATRLQQKGYAVPKAATLVAEERARTEVRYFHTTDAEEATAIAVLLHQAYLPPASISYMRGPKGASQKQPRHYEIWLGPEPR